VCLAVLTVVAVQIAAADYTGAPRIGVPQLERRVHDLINKERTSGKRPVLQWDDRLTQIARGHSADMVKRAFFDHVNPDGADPTARGKRAGYDCRKAIDRTTYREGLAENLAELPRFRRVHITGTRKTYDWNTLEDIARESVSGWMHSPGHRRNILEKAYSNSGVGVAMSSEHIYITQLFC
jgi:uncharacterized protein YkwD